MSYEEIIEQYRIDDICPEIDNELNGFFVDILKQNFDLGIFPEQSLKNEKNFIITVEINCDNVALDKKKIQQIKDAVEERLIHNLGEDWEKIQKNFDGIQLILNEDIL